MAAGRPCRRRRLLALVPLATACSLLVGGLGFLPGASQARQRAPVRGRGLARAATPSDEEDPFQVLRDKNQDDNAFERIMYPEDQMWVVKNNGDVFEEPYNGCRDFNSVFWTIMQPLFAAGFLIVGVSAYFGFPIVNTNPITAKLLPFLADLDGINWIPQGAFMSFYGFFGLFLFGPFQWYLIASNKGRGVAHFDKKLKRFTVIRDDELIKDISFDNIDKVKVEYTELSLGTRDLYLLDKKGKQIRFMAVDKDYPLRVLERRGAQLAEFMGKELVVDSY